MRWGFLTRKEASHRDAGQRNTLTPHGRQRAMTPLPIRRMYGRRCRLRNARPTRPHSAEVVAFSARLADGTAAEARTLAPLLPTRSAGHDCNVGYGSRPCCAIPGLAAFSPFAWRTTRPALLLASAPIYHLPRPGPQRRRSSSPSISSPSCVRRIDSVSLTGHCRRRPSAAGLDRPPLRSILPPLLMALSCRRCPIPSRPPGRPTPTSPPSVTYSPGYSRASYHPLCSACWPT